MYLLFYFLSIQFSVSAIVLFFLCFILLLFFFGIYIDFVVDVYVIVATHDASTTYIIMHGRLVCNVMKALHR